MSDIEERKLATIRTVAKIDPIPGADKIELVTVDGWQCIAQRGIYTVGGKAVYFEIDSFLPVREEFEFLRKSSFKSTKNLGDGFRIKTMKMRGVISQGLLFPINELPELMNFALSNGYSTNKLEPAFPDMFDLTEIIGVQKYEKPIPSNLQGKVRGNFPTFIPKTDQERYQNIKTWQLENYVNVPFEVTTKMDGSSMTVYFNDGDFGVCSRNMNLADDAENNFKNEQTSENLFWKVARKYNMKEMLISMGVNIAFQGELCGPGIQGNPHKLKEHELFIYDVYDINYHRYFSPFERHSLMTRLNSNIPHVPLEYVGVFGPNLLDREYILELAEKSLYNGIEAEGLVFKANDGKLSFKMISPKYLLNEKD